MPAALKLVDTVAAPSAGIGAPIIKSNYWSSVVAPDMRVFWHGLPGDTSTCAVVDWHLLLF